MHEMITVVAFLFLQSLDTRSGTQKGLYLFKVLKAKPKTYENCREKSEARPRNMMEARKDSRGCQNHHNETSQVQGNPQRCKSA